MKHLLKIIINIIVLIAYLFVSILGLIWYGKLMKVSPYHWNYTGEKGIPDFDESFNDNLYQSESFPSNNLYTKKQVLDLLYKDIEVKEYLTNSIPLYENHKKIGTQSLYSLISDKLQ
jgi:hypothetical protein